MIGKDVGSVWNSARLLARHWVKNGEDGQIMYPTRPTGLANICQHVNLTKTPFKYYILYHILLLLNSAKTSADRQLFVRTGKSQK